VFLPKDASRAQIRAAERARKNRLEIIKARSIGQVTRRDLVKWGALTAGGALAFKHGLHPLARPAHAAVPTGPLGAGQPRSPLLGVAKFTQPMPRLDLQQPFPLIKVSPDEARWGLTGHGLPNAKRYSYHEDFNQFVGPVSENPFRNPVTNRGPMEGRPPGEFFKHQRWNEFFPEHGYVLSWGQATPGTKFHPSWPDQEPNKVWAYGSGKFVQGRLPPPLIKLRYGEPTIMRMYNNTPVLREDNGGFGRNETQLHFHNAHNGAESDGATAAHHFPGTFYDYLWSTALARRDTINTGATDIRAASPRNTYGLLLPAVKKVPGDFREIQGTMWMHDHRFFFTAENVYKGALGMVNMYSGRDRGHESIDDAGNLRLPSGRLLPWGNVDFDVNLIFSDAATDLDGQLTFDLLPANQGDQGFLGDLPMVNYAYAPYFEVLPRKYRFRILNACMSRFIKLAFSLNGTATTVPFTFISNDGNLVVNPIPSSAIQAVLGGDEALDQQGTAERYDIVIDFSALPIGSTVQVVNLLNSAGAVFEGARPFLPPLTLAAALAGGATRADGLQADPCVGPWMEFRVVDHVQSVDIPGIPLTVHNSCGSQDKSRVPTTLTEQIPIVEPVRTRHIEFHGAGQVALGPMDRSTCVPDCGEPPRGGANWQWNIQLRIDGVLLNQHRFNANQITALIPRPGEVEHWSIFGGPVWDHPVHMHFEEGVTIRRFNFNNPSVDLPIPPTEQFVRKDVWRVGQAGGLPGVTFQVRFGEFAGSYVTHCHNTVHEDFAMLMRMQLLAAAGGDLSVITPTPIATPDGVHFLTPEILPGAEGDPTLPS
jgi:FtsP/CotA-like multicopper oxidase with cupredoxin domain